MHSVKLSKETDITCGEGIKYRLVISMVTGKCIIIIIHIQYSLLCDCNVYIIVLFIHSHHLKIYMFARSNF